MAKSPARANQEQIQNWVERVAAAFAQHFGLPPITGRILGWLLICDPPEQSAGEIAEAIGASRASLTTSMRLLTVGELVRRRRVLPELPQSIPIIEPVIGIALVAAQLAWQAASVDTGDPIDCLKKFRSNRIVGWLMLAGIVAGHLL